MRNDCVCGSLGRVVKEIVSEKVTFEQRPKEQEETNQELIRGRVFQPDRAPKIKALSGRQAQCILRTMSPRS